MIKKIRKCLSVILIFSMFMLNFAYANTNQADNFSKITFEKMRKESLSTAMTDPSKNDLAKYITPGNLIEEVIIKGVYHGIFKTEDENTWISLSEQQLDCVTHISQSEFKINGKIYKFEVNEENINYESATQSGWTEINYNPASSWSYEGYKTIYPKAEDNIWDFSVGVISIILGHLCGGIPYAGVMIGITALILSAIDFHGYPPSATKINRYTYTSGWLYRKTNLYCYSEWDGNYEYLGLETHYFTKSIGGP